MKETKVFSDRYDRRFAFISETYRSQKATAQAPSADRLFRIPSFAFEFLVRFM